MSITSQGNFEIKYHHIEAPTKTDDEWGREYKQRKLSIPNEIQPADRRAVYRSDELYYLSDNTWFAWRKLDGENIRINWDGEQVLWNGKTNSFVCSADFKDYMEKTFPEEIFEEKFGREKTVTLFGERVGPKVQGNELDLDHEEVVLFDVLIGKTWLTPQQVQEIANYFNLHTPAAFGEMFHMTLDQLIDSIACGEHKTWEGVVAQPWYPLRDRQGNRIIVKIKTKDYYREKKSV